MPSIAGADDNGFGNGARQCGPRTDELIRVIGVCSILVGLLLKPDAHVNLFYGAAIVSRGSLLSVSRVTGGIRSRLSEGKNKRDIEKRLSAKSYS